MKLLNRRRRVTPPPNPVYAYVLHWLRAYEASDAPLSEWQKGRLSALRMIWEMIK